MEKTLIITGWGWNDYACAAAVALRHWKLAEVRGMSTRRLPEFLAEVSGCKTIVILGVGLAGNPELFQQALAKLARKGTHVIWISSLPAPAGAAESRARCSRVPDVANSLPILFLYPWYCFSRSFPVCQWLYVSGVLRKLSKQNVRYK